MALNPPLLHSQFYGPSLNQYANKIPQTSARILPTFAKGQ